jgi:vancomycin permeability regulator SanA
LILLLLVTGPYAWTRIRAAGHVYTVGNAPAADVVIVLGAQVAPDRVHPMPYLAGRLRAAATLIRDGRAKVALLSGDAHGSSGNETGVMTAYLTGDLGIDSARVVADPYGLDTYDT